MLKMYVWTPSGHGEDSFFVLAETEEEAQKSVNSYIEATPFSDHHGWGTDYYKLQIAVRGEVITHPNE